MDYEILSTLQEIRGMLLVILVFFAIWIMSLVYSVLSETLPFLKPKSINDKAQKYFELGKFTKIVKLCESNLSRKPNHLDSVWWLAKAKFNLKEYDDSSRLFKKVLEAEPAWQIEYIQPYIDKIEKIQATAKNV